MEMRGIATLMEFNSFNETTTLEKRRGRGTWYNGHDLRNAACYGRKGLEPFHASINDMIGAMAMNSFEQCYKCMRIVNNKSPNRSVIVKIVDKCAGCQVNKAIDLTPKAFRLLNPKGQKSALDIGVLDISWHPVDCGGRKVWPKSPGLL